MAAGTELPAVDGGGAEAREPSSTEDCKVDPTVGAAAAEVPEPPAPWRGPWRPESVLPEHLEREAQRLSLARRDPELLERALAALRRWHQRFPTQVWGRMTKTGEGGTRHMPKVLKELDEIAPILRQVERWLLELPADAPPAAVVDLCSGFGFLGMFLAELVPDPERHLSEIILVDRGWPNPHIGSKGTISNDHIYEHGKWRVPIQTIKTDIKEQGNVRSLIRRVVAFDDRPCIICAVHLCGTLSLRAAQLFNATARAHALALVPCCMPPKKHAAQEVVYGLGTHTFAAAGLRDTARHDSASGRFRAWVDNVEAAVEPGDGGKKWLEEIRVGSSARHGSKGDAYAQDLHVFACRAPWGALGARPPVEEEAAVAGSPVVLEARWIPQAAPAPAVPPAGGVEEGGAEAGGAGADAAAPISAPPCAA